MTARGRSRSSEAQDDCVLMPPAASQVASRLLCLMSLGARAFFESQLAGTDRDEAREARQSIKRLLAWLGNESLLDSFSAKERPVMRRPPGKWTQQERIDGSWRVESAGVVAWALRLVDRVPPYDEEFRPREIMAAIPQTDEPTRKWIKAAVVRSEDEIAEAREIAEFWLWRSHTTSLQADSIKLTVPPSLAEYEGYIRSAAKTGEANGWFQAIKHDFPAYGKPYADLSPEEYRRVTSIAVERLWGLNWVRGYEPEWDHVPLDT